MSGGARTYGGDYDEWSVACPDGEVWPEVATSERAGRSMLKDSDKACGCESSPHVLVTRVIPEWEAIS